MQPRRSKLKENREHRIIENSNSKMRTIDKPRVERGAGRRPGAYRRSVSDRARCRARRTLSQAWRARPWSSGCVDDDVRVFNVTSWLDAQALNADDVRMLEAHEGQRLGLGEVVVLALADALHGHLLLATTTTRRRRMRVSFSSSRRRRGSATYPCGVTAR